MRTVEVPVPEAKQIKAFAWKCAFVLLILYLAYVVREVWLPLGLAFLLAMVLDPVVDRLEKRGMARTWAALLIFLGFIAIFGGGLALLFPLLSAQARDLQKSLHDYFNDSSHAGLVASFERMSLPPQVAELAAHGVESADAEISRSSNVIAGSLFRFGKNLIWVVIVPIVAFYALRDFHQILAKGLLMLSKSRRDSVQRGIGQATGVFSKYLQGQLIVSTMNGFATAGVLWVLHVPSALLLGLIAGILYTVPYIGAMITIVLTAIVAFIGGGLPLLAKTVICSVVLHQVLFDQIIGPKVVGEHVGLHPIISIMALLIGNLLLGIPGMILAVPAAACIQIAIVSLIPVLGGESDGAAEQRVHGDAQVAEVSSQIEDQHLSATPDA